MSDNIEPIEPGRALELYIANRETSVTQATIYSHRSRLDHFLHTKVLTPFLTGDDNILDKMLDSERAGRILNYLEKYEYTSQPHVVLTLMWLTMMQVGEIHAPDCADYDSAKQSSDE